MLAKSVKLMVLLLLTGNGLAAEKHDKIDTQNRLAACHDNGCIFHYGCFVRTLTQRCTCGSWETFVNLTPKEFISLGKDLDGSCKLCEQPLFVRRISPRLKKLKSV